MFKKAKRANLRRRNDSDEDEQPSTPAQTCGPVVEEIPFMETSFPVVRAAEVQHGNNGFQYNNNNHNLKPIKKEKKFKEICPPPAAIAAPSKASLLSFDDDEGDRLTLASNTCNGQQHIKCNGLILCCEVFRKII